MIFYLKYFKVTYYLDIDECSNQTSLNDCSDRCVNTVGSFMCACSSGYRLASDQRTCIGKYITYFKHSDINFDRY